MNKKVNGTNIFINLFFLIIGLTFYLAGDYVGIRNYSGLDGMILAFVFYIIRHKCPEKVANYASVIFILVYLSATEISADAFTQEYALFIFGALLISLHSDENLIRLYLILNFIYYVISFIVLIIIHGHQDYMIAQLVHGIFLICGIIIIFSYVATKNASERSFIQEAQNFEDLVKVVDDKKKEAQQATKAKSDFLANMSHEIRTPINAIIGMTVLAVREDMSSSAKEYLYRIKQSGKSLLSIINDILDYSKIESGKMPIIESEYEPAVLIDNVAGIINTRMGVKNIDFVVDYDPDIPKMLYGDNNRITQVLVNLVDNAVKYTNSGLVKLSVAQTPVDGGIMLDVDVSDTGIGIKNEDLCRIFSSYEQADIVKNRSIEGTGLGLPICKSLVDAMGGCLKVRSEYGKGSEFSFGIFQRIADKSAGMKVIDPKTKHVGIIADNENIRNSMIFILKSLGIEYKVLNINDEANDQDVNYIFCNNEFAMNVKNRIFKNYNDKNVFLLTGNESVSVPDKVSVIRKPLLCQKMCACLNNVNYADYYFDSDTLFNFMAPQGNILIVDDNDINLKVACGILSPLEIKIDTAKSGQDALDMISNKKYDIIFMDQMMPEMDGIEVVSKIRCMDEEYYHSVPVIALTANATAGIQNMFLSKGFNGYLAKPIELREVSKTIRDWMPEEKIVYCDVQKPD